MADKDSTTGRTPWDFGAELLVALGRLGPSVIVVGGFLAFAYYFYKEVNEARQDADVQLQNRLKVAQEQLVQTYDKMGGMSDQLIQNIQDLLALNQRVDLEVEENRTRLRKVEEQIKQELESAEREAEEARRETEQAERDLERLSAEIDAKRAEMRAEVQRLEDTRKSLAQKIAESERKLQEHETSLAARVRQIDDMNREIEALRQQNAALAAQVLSPAAGPLLPERSVEDPRGQASAERSEAIRAVLSRYLSDPEAAELTDFDSLIGFDSALVEEVARQGLGFSLWMRNAEEGWFLAVTEQRENGFGPFLALGMAEGKISDVQPFYAMLATRSPTLQDWYGQWLILNQIDEYGAFSDYFPFEGETLRVEDLDMIFGSDVTRVVFGEPRIYRLGAIDSWAEEFPRIYDQWRQEDDYLERPSLILRMLARAEGFEAERIEGMGRPGFSEDLRKTLVAILNAAVAGTPERASQWLASHLAPADLGRVAAIVLRDGVRVSDVRLPGVDRGGKALSDSAVVFVDFQPPGDYKGVSTAELSFVPTEGGWLLTEMFDPF